MNAASVFSGVGGLDLAVADVFGAHPLAFCEFEANPSKVLAARWPGVPNLGDVRESAWEDWAGVDVLHGGPPCQPTSSAGKRKGESDDRWMWPAALDAMRRVRPRWVVWENPSALLGLDDGEPFGRILGEMAAMGYMGSFGCLRASDVGCCHGRDRLFILGRAGGPADRRDVLGRRAGDAEQVGLGGGHPAAHAEGDAGWLSNGDGGAAPDSDRGRLQVGPQLDGEAERTASDRHPCGGHADGRSEPAPDSHGTAGGRVRPASGCCEVQGAEVAGWPAIEPRRRGGSGEDGGAMDWGDYAPAIARHAAMLGRPAPAPVDDRGRLSAHLVEWMMAFPAGWVTDVLPRNPALKALGNAVVRPQAAAAMRLLLERVGARAAA